MREKRLAPVLSKAIENKDLLGTLAYFNSKSSMRTQSYILLFTACLAFTLLSGCNESNASREKTSENKSASQSVTEATGNEKLNNRRNKNVVQATIRCSLREQTIELSKKEINRTFRDGSAIFIQHPVINARPGCKTIDEINKRFNLAAQNELEEISSAGGKVAASSNQEGKKKNKAALEAGGYGVYIHEVDLFLFKDSFFSINHSGFDRFLDEDRTTPLIWAENLNLATGKNLLFFDLFEKEVKPVIKKNAAPVFKDLYSQSALPKDWQEPLDNSLEQPDFYIHAEGITMLLSTDEVFQLTGEPHIKVLVPMADVKPFLKINSR